MSDVLDSLCAYAGRYVGQGVNHEQEHFTGRLELRPVVGLRGVVLDFVAIGLKGEVYHEEHTVIAPGEDGTPVLVTLSSNGGGIVTLALRRDEPSQGSARTLVFGIGDDATRLRSDAMRLEQAIDLWPEGELSYRFAWGLPGGELAGRSSVRMQREAADRGPVPVA